MYIYIVKAQADHLLTNLLYLMLVQNSTQKKFPFQMVKQKT